MSEIIPFIRTGPVPSAGKPMSDGERRSVEVALGRMGRAYPYPLSKLFGALATIVRDYNLEDVSYKDLHPKGYVLSANYPNFGLRWVFRLHEDVRPVEGPLISIDEVRLFMNRESKRYASTEFAGRFAYRFLEMLGEHVRVNYLNAQGCYITVVGQIRHEQFPWGSGPHYHPFQMTLERH